VATGFCLYGLSGPSLAGHHFDSGIADEW
jgi:hypothetical protein